MMLAGDSSLIALPPSEEQIETVWRVREAIDALPAAERELVRLQHLEGMSHREIAERLDLPIGTWFKSRSFRAPTACSPGSSAIFEDRPRTKNHEICEPFAPRIRKGGRW